MVIALSVITIVATWAVAYGVAFKMARPYSEVSFSKLVGWVVGLAIMPVIVIGAAAIWHVSSSSTLVALTVAMATIGALVFSPLGEAKGNWRRLVHDSQ